MEVKVIDSLGRHWNPALHPRDRLGRFVETGGIARAWGSGLVRVLRTLDDNYVEVENAAGGRRIVKANTLTMVKRPDGSNPTKNARLVKAEHNRRIADPERGDGVTTADHGDGALLEQPTEPAGRLSPDALHHLSDAELDALLDDSVMRGAYDPDTALALANELDSRHDLGTDHTYTHAADEGGDAWITQAGMAWPADWVAWAASEPEPARARSKRRNTGPTRTELEAEAKAAYQDYILMLETQLEGSIHGPDSGAGVNGQYVKPLYRDHPEKMPPRVRNAAADHWLRGGYTQAEFEKYASDEMKKWAAGHGLMSESEWVARWLADYRNQHREQGASGAHSKDWG